MCHHVDSDTPWHRLAGQAPSQQTTDDQAESRPAETLGLGRSVRQHEVDGDTERQYHHDQGEQEQTPIFETTKLRILGRLLWGEGHADFARQFVEIQVHVFIAN